MASYDSDRDALAKLLQMGTVAEYQSKFEILINRVTGIFEPLLKSFYISGLKLALQRGLLRSRLTTLGQAFSLARITEARFEEENNQAVDNNDGDKEDPNVKQKVKKTDDQEIKNVKDEESKNVEDQQVSEAEDDTNNDDFGCLLPPHKGAELIVEKADGTWVPARRNEDGWFFFDELGLSKESHCKSNLDVHLQFHVDPQDIGSQVKTWDPGIKIVFKTTPYGNSCLE
ncbi:hypothetical protein Tco_1130896 [Tanacetum coccineum]